MGVDSEPVKNKHKWWSLFFITHFFVGNLIIFNTFIGVLILKFNKVRKYYSEHRNLNFT